MSSNSPPGFLSDLLRARAASGQENEAQAVFERYVRPAVDTYQSDTLGNRFAGLNPAGNPVLMLAGHLDEPGFMITFITKTGFLFFEMIGSPERTVAPGRHVVIQGTHGPVFGVIATRPHSQSDELEGKQSATRDGHEIWIDIGARSRKDALARVNIGDVATYDIESRMLDEARCAARAPDRLAAYVAGETMVRLAAERTEVRAHVVATATCQKHLGARGGLIAAYTANPNVALVVDGRAATDYPEANQRRTGEITLSGGPIICRGPNIHPLVFSRLLKTARQMRIPHQIEAEARPSATDARVIQTGRGGIPCGLVRFPVRYVNAPTGIFDVEDIERCVQLLVAFAKSLAPGENTFE